MALTPKTGITQTQGDARYQQLSAKGNANGYASLASNARVPIAQLAAGTPDGSKFVRDDGTLAVPAGGGGGSTSPPFADDTALVKDNLDATKQLRVDASSVATGTTRVLTMPDSDVNLGALALTARAINTTAPLTGGGNLSADRTLAVSAATGSAPGVAQVASQAQADAGTDDATIMTPLKVASRPQKNVVFETFIHGLDILWGTPGTNANNLTVTPGAAWIPSLGRIYNVPSTLTGPTLSFSASTWYYVYLYDNANTPALDISTTAPATPYKGSARAKTADTSRRYLGAVRSDASGTPKVWNFIKVGNKISYRETLTVSPFRVLSAGLATTFTNISCAAVVPPTSRLATVRLNIATANQSVQTSISDASSGAVMVSLPAGVQVFVDHALDSTQNFQYQFVATATGGFYVDLYGYFEDR